MVIPSFASSLPEDLLNHTGACGANNYFYENNTIHFVITGDISCLVQIRLVNSVRISIRLTMKLEDVYNTGYQTNFINMMAAFLNIPTDRMRIVGIKIETRLRVLAEGDVPVSLSYEI